MEKLILKEKFNECFNCSSSNYNNLKFNHVTLLSGDNEDFLFENALICACFLLCKKNFCLNCDDCNNILKNIHQNLYIIKTDTTEIKIDEIRSLKKSLDLYPINSNLKVYIIKDADKMNKNAQNALLKTLEEQKDFLYFILTTKSILNIEKTILSRCVKFNVYNNDFNNKNFSDYSSFLTNYVCIDKEFIENIKFNVEDVLKFTNGILNKDLKTVFYYTYRIYRDTDKMQRHKSFYVLKVFLSLSMDKFFLECNKNIKEFSYLKNKKISSLKILKIINLIEKEIKSINLNLNINLSATNLYAEFKYILES